MQNKGRLVIIGASPIVSTSLPWCHLPRAGCWATSQEQEPGGWLVWSAEGRTLRQGGWEGEPPTVRPVLCPSAFGSEIGECWALGMRNPLSQWLTRELQDSPICPSPLLLAQPATAPVFNLRQLHSNAPQSHSGLWGPGHCPRQMGGRAAGRPRPMAGSASEHKERIKGSFLGSQPCILYRTPPCIVWWRWLDLANMSEFWPMLWWTQINLLTSLSWQVKVRRQRLVMWMCHVRAHL